MEKIKVRSLKNETVAKHNGTCYNRAMGDLGDKALLLSLTNTRLRDGDDLFGAADALGMTVEELVSSLEEAGFRYDAATGQFKAKYSQK